MLVCTQLLEAGTDQGPTRHTASAVPFCLPLPCASLGLLTLQRPVWHDQLRSVACLICHADTRERAGRAMTLGRTHTVASTPS